MRSMRTAVFSARSTREPCTYTMIYLANTLEAEGHYSEAEKLEREVLEIEGHHSGSEGSPDVLASLAGILCHEGRYDEAQQQFHQVIQRASSAKDSAALGSAWYKFASGAAIAGHRDEALRYLGHAIEHGYQDPDGMAKDDDLKSLHGDPRFDELVTQARQTTAKTQ